MKKTKILYWVFTGLFALVMLGTSVPHILVDQASVDGFKSMGLPVYLISFLGWAKVLGIAAILIPGFPRLKEWAYAGLFIDLLGAIYCIHQSGIPPLMWSPMLLFIGLGAASYVYYHKKRASELAQSSETARSSSNSFRTSFS
ncbi:hypothetical protein GCM10027299_19540 [Larkinella ripae]